MKLVPFSYNLRSLVVRRGPTLLTVLGIAATVATVAGAASEFTLGMNPIASTVQAQLDGRGVPRSRANGFDYDPTAQSIVFRGSTWRPRRGQRVGIAAYRWR